MALTNTTEILMTTFTIDAQLVRAAMACQGKKDIRPMLNGIYFGSNGDIVATDGHRLFKATYSDNPIGENLIISINGTIPVSATSIEFDTDLMLCKTDNGKVFPIDLVDAQYPDYQRIIPKYGDLTDSPLRAFNTSYLASIEKVYGKGAAVIIESYDETSPAIFRPLEHNPIAEYTPIMIIMPIRFDNKTRLLESYQTAKAA